jgi:hypothetical protein
VKNNGEQEKTDLSNYVASDLMINHVSMSFTLISTKTYGCHLRLSSLKPVEED